MTLLWSRGAISLQSRERCKIPIAKEPIVTEAEDILQLLWPNQPSKQKQGQYNNFAEQLEGSALSVFQLLGHEPRHSDEIARECGLTPMELSAILLDLELRGGIQTLPGNHYIRGQL